MSFPAQAQKTSHRHGLYTHKKKKVPMLIAPNRPPPPCPSTHAAAPTFRRWGWWPGAPAVWFSPVQQPAPGLGAPPSPSPPRVAESVGRRSQWRASNPSRRAPSPSLPSPAAPPVEQATRDGGDGTHHSSGGVAARDDAGRRASPRPSHVGLDEAAWP